LAESAHRLAPGSSASDGGCEARGQRERGAAIARALATLAVGALCGCAASIPRGSYGVQSIEIQGAEHVDEDAIKACLAVHPRERFGFVLGGKEAPQCGVPPFDGGRLPVELWAWPWTDWPIFNQTAFERDLDRIERWYLARGYYGARVTNTGLVKNEQERQVAISITVQEGEPVLMVRITVTGLAGLDARLQREVSRAIELHPGEPFDEAFYERSKRALLEALQEGSYAKAAVEGSVQVDPVRKLARVEIRVSPGPRCRFGNVAVEGNRNLPALPIVAAASIKRGQPFSLSALRDARYAIHALGPFASVDVVQLPRKDDSVDVVIRVVPGRMFRFGVGVGMDSGNFFAQEGDLGATGDSFAQWDVHLLGRIEHRNFLGGMRKLRIEDRPRLVFDQPFPGTGRIKPGNLLTTELRQPAFVDSRTTLVARLRWDRGPDPYGGNFQRHLVVASVGPERFFFQGKLLLASTINTDLFLPDKQDPYPNYELTYLYHVARLDLRDDPRNTHRGSFFTFGVQHAGYFLPSAWNYVRLTQDSRGYVALPGGLVLAGRARLGFMAVTRSSISVPSAPAPSDSAAAAELSTHILFLKDLAALGPISHRLRGGGHNSVRGYAPNTLGDAELINNRLISGGLRQWEASLELRIPVTESFGTVLFADAGDVSRGTSYRFNYPQTSFGLGLRYRTIVGPLRLDAALAPHGMQVIGKDERIRTGIPQSRVFKFADGAVSFTIGEAF
jgi:outer membrane protein assembly factor BamA